MHASRFKQLRVFREVFEAGSTHCVSEGLQVTSYAFLQKIAITITTVSVLPTGWSQRPQPPFFDHLTFHSLLFPRVSSTVFSVACPGAASGFASSSPWAVLCHAEHLAMLHHDGTIPEQMLHIDLVQTPQRCSYGGADCDVFDHCSLGMPNLRH